MLKVGVESFEFVWQAIRGAVSTRRLSLFVGVREGSLCAYFLALLFSAYRQFLLYFVGASMGTAVCVHVCLTLLTWVYLVCYQFCYHIFYCSPLLSNGKAIEA